LPRRPPDALIELGRVAAPYGVRGWMKVAGNAEALAAVPRWSIDGIERPVEQARPHSAWLLAKLGGIETREQAKALKGKPILAPRASLPEPPQGTYYWADLVGLEVVNLQGRGLGKVRALRSGGAQHIAEIADGKRVRLVPWVSAIVKHVDLAGGRIEIDWEADW
jgi:16S rRNA processing protein RimM